ncbi:YqaA family protein [Thiomicrorhabdus sediminis]|uniref:DedA family protein n=1 Tax=Thiomicrorhabdus sediminis TaxID=2580412 RepID=A0A4P9K7F7_9GAMM|nr:YqaA family protein [Thiomicrorhabdus sediminis]QCU91064.1 DedA family protein [Thiomicrorhabdus sediminis]
MQWFIDLGFTGLFIGSFLAATILPFGSEALLVTLVANDFPVAELVLIATLGNVLGSLLNYVIGFYGGDYLVHRVLRISEPSYEKAQQRFQKWGLWSLLFAWVPIIGDPLTVVAGALKVKIIWFIVLVSFGKLARYMVVAYGAVQLQS